MTTRRLVVDDTHDDPSQHISRPRLLSNIQQEFVTHLNALRTLTFPDLHIQTFITTHHEGLLESDPWWLFYFLSFPYAAKLLEFASRPSLQAIFNHNQNIVALIVFIQEGLTLNLQWSDFQLQFPSTAQNHRNSKINPRINPQRHKQHGVFASACTLFQTLLREFDDGAEVTSDSEDDDSPVLSLTMIYHAIVEYIHPQSPHQMPLLPFPTPMFRQASSLDPTASSLSSPPPQQPMTLSQIAQHVKQQKYDSSSLSALNNSNKKLTLNYNTDFSPSFYWFRHHLSNYSPTPSEGFNSKVHNTLTHEYDRFMNSSNTNTNTNKIRLGAQLLATTAGHKLPPVPPPNSFIKLCCENNLLNSYHELSFHQLQVHAVAASHLHNTNLHNTPVHSNSSKLLPQSSLPQPIITAPPPYVQFSNFSNTPHPIFTPDRHAMNNHDLVQTSEWQRYFIGMFLIGNFVYQLCNPNSPSITRHWPALYPNPLQTSQDSTDTNDSRPKTHNHPTILNKPRLSLLHFFFQNSTPFLTHQFHLLHYRIFRLSMSSTHTINNDTTKADPLALLLHSTSLDSFSLINPLFYTLLAQPTINLDVLIFHKFGYISPLKHFIALSTLRDTDSWLNTFYTCNMGVNHLCSLYVGGNMYLYLADLLERGKERGEKLNSPNNQHFSPSSSSSSKPNTSDVFRAIYTRGYIELGYKQYLQRKQTIYQQCFIKITQTPTQQPSAYQYNPFQPAVYTKDFCHCYLAFFLLAPFLLFPNHLNLLTTHILLMTHAAFLSPFLPTKHVFSTPPSSSASIQQPFTQFQSEHPLENSVHIYNHVMTPIRFFVYSWLLTKSGLQRYLPHLVLGKGLEFLLHDLIMSKHDRCSRIVHESINVPRTQQANYRASFVFTPNPIQLLPNNPLSDFLQATESAPIKSIQVDTGGNILSVSEEIQAVTTSANSPPTDFGLKTSSKPITIVLVHDPFAIHLPELQTTIDIQNQNQAADQISFKLKTPPLIALQRKYKQYLEELALAESTLIQQILVSVLNKAIISQLLDLLAHTPQSSDILHSYPFPPPIANNNNVTNFELSTANNNNVTNLELKERKLELSAWCIEMLLVSSLNLQPSCWILKQHDQYKEVRPVVDENRSELQPRSVLAQSASKILALNQNLFLYMLQPYSFITRQLRPTIKDSMLGYVLEIMLKSQQTLLKSSAMDSGP